ncbi:hypothetical protein KKE48_02395 [Patescibacteria group bacterium]|nr:hypothetical protein [Patescibacteria group bacterium]
MSCEKFKTKERSLPSRIFDFSPLSNLRANLDESSRDNYLSTFATQLENYLPNIYFSQIREMLANEGISVTRMSKRKGKFGFLTEVLGIGVIEDGQVIEENRVGMVGICLPEKINLQTILPLFIARELMLLGKLEKLYVALPVASYALVGFPRQTQYYQLIELVRQMFGEKVGESVVLMPDYRLYRERSLLAQLASPYITDKLAKHKYPYDNLFSFIETAGFGADVALPALVEKEDVLVIADFMQYESLHAGFKTARLVEQKMEAVLLPLLSPQVDKEKGVLVQVSHMSEEFSRPPEPMLSLEITPSFLAGLLVMDEEEAKDLYNRHVNGRELEYKNLELVRKVITLQDQVAGTPPLNTDLSFKLEERCLKKFNGVSDQLIEEVIKRMRVNPKTAKMVTGGLR